MWMLNWSDRAQSRKGPRQRTCVHGAFYSAGGTTDRALMRYPVLVQTRMGSPDRLVLPTRGASGPCVTSAPCMAVTRVPVRG